MHSLFTEEGFSGAINPSNPSNKTKDFAHREPGLFTVSFLKARFL